MSILERILILFAGVVAGIGIVMILQKERVFAAAKHLKGYSDSLLRYTEQRRELQQRVNFIKTEIATLKKSILQLEDERELMDVVWGENDFTLRSTKRVNADEAIIFGNGPEWIYLYTFPTHEQLAQARQLRDFPMKLGMSAQADVVTRVDQQVAGNSTAISERAVIRLVFRVNNSREVERWMHEFLIRNGRQVSGSVGVEWFNTNTLEVEQLFRSYVLQGRHRPSPAPIQEFV